MYKTKVDLRSRKAMVEFLTNHFRYCTMNSWNGNSSYANNVKYYNLDLTNEQASKFFEMLNMEDSEFYECYMEPLIEGFREETGYTVGVNGRSGGYLVVYKFEWETLDYKSRCTSCHQLSYADAKEGDCKCGKCGKDTRVNLTRPLRRMRTLMGGIDQDEDFEDWSLDSIRERVKMVQRFDELCDDIRNELVYYLDSHNVVEEEYSVTKTRKVFKEII